MRKGRRNKSGRAPEQRQQSTSTGAARTAAPVNYDEVMPKYAALMESVKERVATLDTALPGLVVNGVGDLAKLQMAALLLRQILETIAFGSLVLNKSLYDLAHQDAARQWSAKRLLDRIEKLNSRFYPTPVAEIQHDSQQREIVSKTSGFLTKEEFIALYDKCSGIIHQKNPLDSNYGHTDFAGAIPTWRSKVVDLLNTHQLYLPGDTGFYLVHMSLVGDDRVHWYRFELVGPATWSRSPSA